MSFTTAWNLHGSSSASASDADSQCAGVAWPLVAPGGTFMILTSKRTVAWLVAWRTSACATLENCIDEISVINITYIIFIDAYFTIARMSPTIFQLLAFAFTMKLFIARQFFFF